MPHVTPPGRRHQTLRQNAGGCRDIPQPGTLAECAFSSTSTAPLPVRLRRAVRSPRGVRHPRTRRRPDTVACRKAQRRPRQLADRRPRSGESRPQGGPRGDPPLVVRRRATRLSHPLLVIWGDRAAKSQAVLDGVDALEATNDSTTTKSGFLNGSDSAIVTTLKRPKPWKPGDSIGYETRAEVRVHAAGAFVQCVVTDAGRKDLSGVLQVLFRCDTPDSTVTAEREGWRRCNTMPCWKRTSRTRGQCFTPSAVRPTRCCQHWKRPRRFPPVHL